MADRPYLRRLAAQSGIIPRYRDGLGRVHDTSDRTRVALLAAMGVDAASESAARRALRECRDRRTECGVRIDEEDPFRVPGNSETPQTCLRIDEVLGARRAFGIWANLYTLRTADNAGAGDLGDLRRLVRWAGRNGAEFVGINPLHAIDYRPLDASPYSPTTRLFHNPVYLRLEDVPEFEEWTRLHPRDAARLGRVVAELRRRTTIPYEDILATRQAVLRGLFGVFVTRHLRTDSSRARAFHRYVSNQRYLPLFAAFRALSQRFRRDRHPLDWRHWPAAFRESQGESVRQFTAHSVRELEIHQFVQFELDRQLGEVAKAAKRAGLRLGLFNDLALGSAADGFDVWAFPDLFARGAAVGAPPDSHSRTGQNWSLPPIVPWRLAETGYRYWIDVLGGIMRHAGMIRIDHVMGLFRQFWVPEGRPATEGAYVRYPARHLLAVLAHESRRHRAAVVGEDLGTVPRNVPAIMQRRGILSTRLLYFEKNRAGRFREAARYHPNAVVMVNTHDHAPLAGFASAVDVCVRRAIGMIREKALLRKRLRDRGREVAELLARLATDGLLPATRPVGYADLVAAVYLFLARTPAPLVAVGLDDLAGEELPVNLPGVPQRRYPNWTRRMSRSLEEITKDPALTGLLRRLGAEMQRSARGVRR